MKNSFRFIVLTGIVVGLLVTGCGSTPAADSDIAVQSPEKAGSRKKQVSYFDGNGGKGIRIAVLQPEGNGLSAGEQYLLTLIQGSITGDFNKYSAITVTDRRNLDKILQEQNLSLNGDFSDENYIRIGNLTNSQYMLTGSVTKAQNTFILELSITDVETGERRASYPPRTCTERELRELGAVKDASEDLLAQMGVRLTVDGKQALHMVNASMVNAETALSRAIVAQKGGTVIEAMVYYYDAVGFNPSLSEATERLSGLTTEMKTGNIGENVRNEIAQRNAWLARLTECAQYFKEHLPYELVYDPTLTQGKVDFLKETVELSFKIASKPTDGFKVVQNIMDGLIATGRTGRWGLNDWPLNSTQWGFIGIETNMQEIYTIHDDGGTQTNGNWGGDRPMIIEVDLLNEQGKSIAYTKKEIINKVGFPANVTDTVLLALPRSATITFRDVKAADITDHLTVKITRVNGIDVEGINNYIKISAGDTAIDVEPYRRIINRFRSLPSDQRDKMKAEQNIRRAKS
jgi:hypothetical protein